MPKVIDEMQIYRAVMETISQRGYTGATMRQIAETAGVGEVTLFRKYGTKVELVKRAIASLIKQTQFEQATQYSGDIHADLLHILHAYQGSVISNIPFFMVILAEIPNAPELADVFSQPLGLYQSMGQLLARYQAEDVLKPENPLQSIAALLGPFIYLSMLARASTTTEVPALDLETHIAHFLNGRVRTG